MRYRAVFFDAGETLLHPHPSFPELLTSSLRREGIEVEPDAVKESLSLLSDRLSESAKAGELWSTSAELSRRFWASIYRAVLAKLGVTMPDGIADRLYETFTDLSNYRLFSDVQPVLDRLAAAGLSLGLISNFEEWLEQLLESLAVTRYFHVRVISGLEGMEKPDPRIFRLALERAGASPEESLYVGDSPSFDVEPAESIGMRGVLIDRRERFPRHPGTRIVSLDELPGVLGLKP
ncbi:HAD family hydrolase [soil metagenome]